MATDLKRSLLILAIVLPAVILNACATQKSGAASEVTPGTAGGAAQEEPMEKTGESSAAQVIPLDKTRHTAAPAPDVVGLGKRLMAYPRALWRSRSQSYEIFVGRLLVAGFSPTDKLLTLSTDNPDGNNLVCKYSLDGKLDIQTPQNSNAPDGEQQCNTMLDRLDALHDPFQPV